MIILFFMAMVLSLPIVTLFPITVPAHHNSVPKHGSMYIMPSHVSAAVCGAAKANQWENKKIIRIISHTLDHFSSLIVTLGIL